MKNFYIIICLTSFYFASLFVNRTYIAQDKIQAVFDAYEGELYFFTEKKSNHPLTLKVRNDHLIENYGFEEALHIGTTFELQIIKEGKDSIISSINKL